MKQLMESIHSFLDFVGSYPIWAKVLMLAGILTTIGIMIFVPRKQTEAGATSAKEFTKLVEKSSTAEEFRSNMLLNKQVIADHLRAKTSYEAVDIAYNISVNGVPIDLVVFYHYKEQTQIPHVLFLVKFFDVQVKKTDWDELHNDWAAASAALDYGSIRAILHRTNGFNSPIEYPDPTEPGMNAKPTVIYNQIYGRRKFLNQTELGSMQKINAGSEQVNRLYRWTGTYDQIIEGLNFFSKG